MTLLYKGSKASNKGGSSTQWESLDVCLLSYGDHFLRLEYPYMKWGKPIEIVVHILNTSNEQL